MKSKLILLFLLLSITIFAQPDPDFPAVTIDDIPGGKISRAEYFNGDGLWGHINGGADVYLEYGFDKLLFQDISWNGFTFRVEFYRMIDPEAAYGIYSISKFKCEMTDTISKFVCITSFQAQSALGRFYISIANDKGTSEAKEAAIQLFDKILAKERERLYYIPDFFNKDKLEPHSSKLKFVKGELGLQNGFTSWSDYFTGISNYSAYILPVEENKNYFNIGLISFSSVDETTKFRNRILMLNKQDSSSSRIIHEFSPKHILFLESNLPETKAKEFLKSLL